MNFNILSPDLIDSDNLSRLITGKIPENKNLEYKRDLDIKGDGERKEFLADISSFANSDGGLIIFGVSEEKNENSQNTGIPDEIIGFSGDTIDFEISRIEGLISSCIQPRINNLLIKRIEIASKILITIIIPKNYGIPHMVTYKSTNKFYKRGNSGKYLVDVFELNQMFMQSNELQERANKFVSDRMVIVLNKEFIPNIITENASFIHIVPLSFQQNLVRLTDGGDYSTILGLFGPIVHPTNHHHDFEGYILTSMRLPDTNIYIYFQAFRNSILEYYATDFISPINQDGDQLYFLVNRFEIDCINLVTKAIEYYNIIGISNPFLVFISLFGLTKVKIGAGFRFWDSNIINRQSLRIPPILIKSYESNIAESLKPAFDVIWQSSGYAKSFNYNSEGGFIWPKHA